MILIQILISLIVPALMVAAGKITRSKAHAFMSPGLAYRTKAAVLSEESWDYANTIFGATMLCTGINVGIISTVFILVAVLAAEANGWFLALFLICFQIVGCFGLVLFTEIMLGRLFDSEGHPYPSPYDVEDEDTDSAVETDGIE